MQIRDSMRNTPRLAERKRKRMKVSVTVFPMAVQHGTISVPDDVKNKDVRKYLQDHWEEIVFDCPELDYNGADFAFEQNGKKTNEMILVSHGHVERAILVLEENGIESGLDDRERIMLSDDDLNDAVSLLEAEGINAEILLQEDDE